MEEEDSMSNDREILRATGRVTTRTGFTNDGTQTSSPAGLASESSMKVIEERPLMFPSSSGNNERCGENNEVWLLVKTDPSNMNHDPHLVSS